MTRPDPLTGSSPADRPDARLVVFDVDGTLSDSQAHILAAMTSAFASVDLAPPPRAAILSIVGLSLEVAIPRLAPDLDETSHIAIVAGYRDSFRRNRLLTGPASTPLYPGIRAVVETLAAQPETILGIATGKSLRGLEALLDGHGLRRHFLTVQVADHHPSKPHPSMLLAAMAETGIGPDRAVMIGDTTFDMDMARTAGMQAIGVGWGYHPPAELHAAGALAARAEDLPGLIDRMVPLRAAGGVPA